jgi:hypothetical protein
MESQVFSSIDLSWASLRYAEVEHQAGDVRPLRLGSCDFDFNVTRELLHAEAPTHLDVVAEALRDVFAGSKAEQLRIVVHPPEAYSFVTAIPSEWSPPERSERFQQEAALLADTQSEAGLHVTASVVHAADTHLDVEPVHVLAVPRDRHARLETVVRRLPHGEGQWMLSTHAAARVMMRTAPPPLPSETSIGLVVGIYPDYTEYGLLRNGRWYFSHYTEAEEPADATYFATALLDQLGVPRSAVTRIGLYGIGANVNSFAPFETVFGVMPELIDPFGVLGLDSTALQGTDFGAGAYVPCIGAAL